MFLESSWSHYLKPSLSQGVRLDRDLRLQAGNHQFGLLVVEVAELTLVLSFC